MAQGKGPAYERWAKVYNLKQMAAALQYVQEDHLTDYAALTASTEKAVERFHTLSEELRQTEAELEKTSGLMAAKVDLSLIHIYGNRHMDGRGRQLPYGHLSGALRLLHL